MVSTKSRSLPRGVYCNRLGFRAEAVIGGVKHYVGTFRSPEAASEAREAFRRDKLGDAYVAPTEPSEKPRRKRLGRVRGVL